MLRNRLEEQFACEHCFGYPELRSRFAKSSKRANCHWCGARSARVLPLNDFGDEFRSTVSQFYQSDDHGEYIDELLLADWPQILNRCFQRRSAVHRRSFLIAILEAGMTQKELYTEGVDYSGFFSRIPSTLVGDWQDKIELIIRGDDSLIGEMANELPDEDGVPSRLEVALEDLSFELRAGTTLFRARIHEPSTRRELFTISDLQAPPPDKVLHGGRVNEKGQSVFYLGSDANTAIGEVRAFKGAAIAVGNVRLTRDVNLIDTVKLNLVRPFGDDLLKWTCDLWELLHRFGWELSRPILPTEKEQGYKPTQRLAEFIRRSGYAGIKYPSARGAGYPPTRIVNRKENLNSRPNVGKSSEMVNQMGRMSASEL